MAFSLLKEAARNFVEIKAFDPRIQLDIRYATVHNFLGFAVYSKAACYLHREVAEALKCVQDELELLELFIKIYDGYRPLPVQQLMWDMIQDETYVSNPAKNKSVHTRGTAVDLTLVDSEGNELEMPSAFDEFTERSHSFSLNATKEALLNRALLKSIMEKKGFSQCLSEWWHFDFNGWNNDVLYPPMSVTFEEIDHLNVNNSLKHLNHDAY